ncbi:MAG: ribonuclease HI [Holosporales bacterium]|jgi:ribonuclease HI|nr:ribonuclease HI [Holosporales bacterium]
MENNFLKITDVEFDELLKYLRDGSKIEIYTDGSCLGNPGPGGWAGVFIFEDKRAGLSGFEKSTTNNRMELRAAIESIKAVPPNVSITIHTDSTYLKNGITEWIKNWQKNNWKRSTGGEVKNQDLWMELASLVENVNIEWKWVKGHFNSVNNNNADALARNAIVASYIEE